MISLTDEQEAIVNDDFHQLVVACPGSGKTRVLTARVARGVQELSSIHRRVAAVTFTHRAADEVEARLRNLNLETGRVWAGTIHAFALEWVLRPYAGYSKRLRRGFTVAGERYTDVLKEDLRRQHGLGQYDEVPTKPRRDGSFGGGTSGAQSAAKDYHRRLREEKLIDFDLILYLGYKLCARHPAIAANLANVFELICVDEYQDTQDLQYALLGQIMQAATDTTVFLVGDPDQAIFASLGGVARTRDEIAQEFSLTQLPEQPLTGNFRSTQRMIDFYLQFRAAGGGIVSRTGYANEPGTITFENQTVARDDVPHRITELLREHLDGGGAPSDACVVAPQWKLLAPLARQLAARLPGVPFNAPGLSPIPRREDDIWYNVTRLFLTLPGPESFHRRLRWAQKVAEMFERETGVPLGSTFETPRSILRLQNGITSPRADAIDFLQDVLPKFVTGLGVDLTTSLRLVASLRSFLDGARARLSREEFEDVPRDLDTVRSMFTRPSGVVVHTCQGVKGEEYETVICFSLLHGMVPHWESIFDTSTDEEAEARRLLYVVASRAKRRLHLISESGRRTRKGKAYRTTSLLAASSFTFDDAV